MGKNLSNAQRMCVRECNLAYYKTDQPFRGKKKKEWSLMFFNFVFVFPGRHTESLLITSCISFSLR